MGLVLACALGMVALHDADPTTTATLILMTLAILGVAVLVGHLSRL
jgi:hypothetical protein